MRRSFCILFFLLMIKPSSAQFYETGQDPQNISWMQIKTEHFIIIYPIEIREEAQKYANMFEKAYEPLSHTLNVKAEKIPVILHNRSTESNAMVPWAPKRIEIFTCPDQNIYSQPWADQLVLHEFRHVVQLSKINTKFSRILYYIFGEQITAGITGVYIPFWLIEGDAVVTETLFSQSGRGRDPGFEMPLRTQIMNHGIYNYNKAVFGSYRDFVPDHYILGYHLVSSARIHYGAEIWEHAFDKTARMPYMFVPFNSGIRKISGMNKNKLYHYCMKELDSLWQIQNNTINKSSFTAISDTHQKFFTSYIAAGISNRGIIAVKTGMDDITRFVLIDSNGMEHLIFTPGSYLPASLSVSKNGLYWCETQNNIRWSNSSRPIIRKLNIDTRKISIVNEDQRLYAPSVNRQGSRIAAVEQSIVGQSKLVILDPATGKIIKSYTSPDKEQFITPSWSEDGNHIVFIALNKDGKRICIADTMLNIKDISAASHVEIWNPVMYGKNIYYTAAYSGINNIYVTDTAGNHTWMISSSQYGADRPLISNDGKEVYYSDYSAGGYRLVKYTLDSSSRIPDSNIRNHSVKLYEKMIGQESGPIDFYSDTLLSYPEKPYSKIRNLFNIHSWGPLSVDANNNSLKPGIQVQSQDLLSTMTASAGYEYSPWQGSGKFFAGFRYSGLYPELSLNFSYTMQHSGSIRWNTLNINTSAGLPLNLSRGKWYRYIQPRVSYGFYQLIPARNYPEDAFAGYYHALEYTIFGYNLHKTSYKDLSPKWGQMIEMNFKHTPFGGMNAGYIFSAETRLFFPGMIRHHSFNTYLAFQQKEGPEYTFSDLIAFPSGYNITGKTTEFVMKTNYELPLFYPDWSVGSVFYIKRFRGSVFYDFGLSGTDVYDFYQSAGASLLMDFHFLRFIAPLSIGIKTSYCVNIGKLIPQFLYSVNFDELYSNKKHKTNTLR